jgi:AcrR family transcriptional regulator
LTLKNLCDTTIEKGVLVMEKKGLRERQKATRRARILEVARKKFQDAGYSNVTVEDIAADSEVSSVTVYNYFGSKAGLLLALVGKSDLILIRKLDECAKTEHQSLADAVLEYGGILREHAMIYLQKPTWREVVSSSISEGNREFGKTYRELDGVLIQKMQAMIVELQNRDLVARNLDTVALADCLFSLQNIRFFQFIADDTMEIGAADKKFHQDLMALQAAFGG